MISQIRGLLLERGIPIRKGRKHVEASLPHILEDAENKLSGALRALLTQLQIEMQYLHRQVSEESDKLIRMHRQRTRTIPEHGRDPPHWTGDRHGHHRGHRQRGSLQEGPGDLLPGWGWFPGEHPTKGQAAAHSYQ